MKHWKQRWAALALSAALLLPAAPAAFASEALGSTVTTETTELATGTALTSNRLWSATYHDLRTEHYVTYAPGQGVVPTLSFGSTVVARTTVSSMAAALTGQGERVVAGVNGGFYNVSTGSPVGLVIRNGELASTSTYQYAIGFKEDGTAIVGQPVTTVTAEIRGETVKVAGGLNKTRTATGGIFLISDIYAANTQNTAAGVDVILTPENGARPALGATLSCTVDEVRASESSNTLPAGKLVLTINGSGDPALIEKLSSLTAGETVSLSFASDDPAWNDVVTAVGSTDRLVSGGVALTGLAPGAAPRSAIGVKADGSVVLYTIDGRQSGYSVGASYTQVAQRLVELGCVEAVALDGGGSTTLGAALPGGTFALQNRPSDGRERSVSNSILLTFALKDATGVLNHFEVGPGGAVLLSGAVMQLAVTAVDTAYHVMTSPTFTYSVSGTGQVDQNGVYTAGTAGTDTVTVTGGGKTGSVSIVTVATPDSIQVVREGTSAGLSALTLEPGQTVELSAVSTWRNVDVTAQDTCYTWSVDPAVGAVDADGTLTVGSTGATGNLTVKAGDKTVSIPVTVNGMPFEDVAQGAWYYDAVRYVYDGGLFEGVSARAFAPDTTMNRGMLATVLWRMAGTPEPDALQTEPAGEDGESAAPAGVFTDVPADAYYAKAVAWAAQRGIVDGMGNGQFQPDGKVTRQQIAAMLYRYAVQAAGKDVTLPADAPTLDGFADRAEIAGWADEAMTWAVGTRLMEGDAGQRLTPGADATRCQVAAMLMRFQQ